MLFGFGKYIVFDYGDIKKCYGQSYYYDLGLVKVIKL